MTPSLRSLSAGLCLLAAGSAQALDYSATVFNVPGASSSYLYDINNSGAMVGNASIAGANKPFVYQGGSFSFLTGPSGAVNTLGLGLSEGGWVVGSYADSLIDDGAGNMVPGPNKGFLFDGSSYTTIHLDGATETVARAISPNGRYVTGYAIDDEGFSGWLLDRSSNTMTVITSGVLVIAQGVDNSGRVVGSRAWQEGGVGPLLRQSFWYEAGALSYFQLAGQTDSRARAFNDAGLLAGFVVGGGSASAFVGTQDDYALISYAGNFTYAEGINDAGIAVGSYMTAEGQITSLIFAPVPEPATAALLLGGLGLIGLRRRRA